jgi:hypothetical protein
MARSRKGMSEPARAGRTRSAVRSARRLWPYVLMAWEHWQNLTDEEKERYRKQARGYMNRGKSALDAQRRKRPPQ